MNELPDCVQEQIDKLVFGVSLDRLVRARESVSCLYREKRVEGGIKNLPKLGLSASKVQSSFSDEHLAYLVFRLPATYSALVSVFEEIKQRKPDFVLGSLLDLGSGPATAYVAALSCFDAPFRSTLVERDASFISLAKTLIPETRKESVRWDQEDMRQYTIKEPHDLVMLSYALGELDEKSEEVLLEKAWSSTGELLCIVEPGTPHGYQKLMRARNILLQKGAFCLAPCPHELACPLKEGDWCHFSCRLPRSRLHRQVKGGELGYEDEKYSYLVLSKTKPETRSDRILRKPQKSSGVMHFDVCSKKGVCERKVVSKRDKEAFSSLKKKEWGDIL